MIGCDDVVDADTRGESHSVGSRVLMSSGVEDRAVSGSTCVRKDPAAYQ
jgi:hypothetical protein